MLQFQTFLQKTELKSSSLCNSPSLASTFLNSCNTVFSHKRNSSGNTSLSKLKRDKLNTSTPDLNTTNNNDSTLKSVDDHSSGAGSRGKKIFSSIKYDWKSLRSTTFSVGFIDTHCHLDFLFNKAGHTGTLSTYTNKLLITAEADVLKFPISFEGCISIFCQPNTFSKVSLIILNSFCL